jgi:3',5'-cyclic AMP phosphodiesterase CpdA
VQEWSITRVAFFSDTHLAATAAEGPTAPDARLRAAVEAAAGAGPIDAVVLPGDIADDGSAAAYVRVNTIVGALGVPVVATPGNHDLRDAVRDHLEATEAFMTPHWRILTVDTVIPEQIHGRVDAVQVEALLGPDRGIPTVVVLHHPPITVSSNRWFVLDGSADLVTLFSGRSDVRLVVTGHLHTAFHAVLADVTYIGCSSTWYSLAHHDEAWTPDDGHVGSLVVDLHDDGHFTWQRIAS